MDGTTGRTRNTFSMMSHSTIRIANERMANEKYSRETTSESSTESVREW